MAVVDLAWTDNSSSENGFNVYRTTTASPSFPGDYTQIDSTGTDVTTYSDTSAPDGETVHYAVTAFNANGESGATKNNVTTPSAVLNPVISPVDVDTIDTISLAQATTATKPTDHGTTISVAGVTSTPVVANADTGSLTTNTSAFLRTVSDLTDTDLANAIPSAQASFSTVSTDATTTTITIGVSVTPISTPTDTATATTTPSVQTRTPIAASIDTGGITVSTTKGNVLFPIVNTVDTGTTTTTAAIAPLLPVGTTIDTDTATTKTGVRVSPTVTATDTTTAASTTTVQAAPIASPQDTLAINTNPTVRVTPISLILDAGVAATDITVTGRVDLPGPISLARIEATFDPTINHQVVYDSTTEINVEVDIDD